MRARWRLDHPGAEKHKDRVSASLGISSEWFEAFHLTSIHLPPIKLDRLNSAIGRSADHYFHDFSLPFQLMDLRHRWAIRTLEYGLNYQVAAHMMGHGYQVHERIYHRWIDRGVLQSAYDRSLVNRPSPPLPNSLD